jgi:hypothetical protein
LEQSWEKVAGADDLDAVRRALERYLADRRSRT